MERTPGGAWTVAQRAVPSDPLLRGPPRALLRDLLTPSPRSDLPLLHMPTLTHCAQGVSANANSYDVFYFIIVGCWC